MPDVGRRLCPPQEGDRTRVGSQCRLTASRLPASNRPCTGQADDALGGGVELGEDKTVAGPGAHRRLAVTRINPFARAHAPERFARRFQSIDAVNEPDPIVAFMSM